MKNVTPPKDYEENKTTPGKLINSHSPDFVTPQQPSTVKKMPFKIQKPVKKEEPVEEIKPLDLGLKPRMMLKPKPAMGLGKGPSVGYTPSGLGQ